MKPEQVPWMYQHQHSGILWRGCVCQCMLMYVQGMCVHRCIFMCVQGTPEALHRFPILHFEAGYPSHFLAFFLGLAGSSCLCLFSTETANALQHRAFLCGFGDLNSGPHVGTASTLPTELSLHPTSWVLSCATAGYARSSLRESLRKGCLGLPYMFL